LPTSVNSRCLLLLLLLRLPDKHPKCHTIWPWLKLHLHRLGVSCHRGLLLCWPSWHSREQPQLISRVSSCHHQILTVHLLLVLGRRSLQG
jgi:hypothetical protein